MTPGFAVATSGGRDSTALLHAALAAAKPLALEVHALHVHHGLQPAADDWLHHVQRHCERWAEAGAPLRFHAQRLAARPPRGASIEAWAREQRYAALAAMARACGVNLVLLAHHRRDQAETFLLQALRGGGAAGLAAMPKSVVRDGITWARPWLEQPRSAIEAYVRRHRLDFVDDPSNEDRRFARSRLRLHVWPVLEAAFPDAEASLAAAAAQAREARCVLDEVMAADVAAISDEEGVLVSRWSGLSRPRQAGALRAWLRLHTGRGAPETLLRRLMTELPGTGPARWPLGPTIELRRYRGRLQVHRSPGPREPGPVVTLRIEREGEYRVPAWHGTLKVGRARRDGVAFERLQHCELRPREGAEQFSAGPARPARSLKKQFQAAAVAPWQRHAPLLYCAGRLVFVPGLGIDASQMAPEGAPQAALEWVPDETFAAPQ